MKLYSRGPYGFWEVHTASDGPRLNQSNCEFHSCYTIRTADLIHAQNAYGPKEDEKGPPRWKQCHPGLIENGGVWTLPVDCRPIESLKFKWHLIKKASQIYILVIFISFSLNVTLFNWHKVNNVTQILISNVNLAGEPKRSSWFKPF